MVVPARSLGPDHESMVRDFGARLDGASSLAQAELRLQSDPGRWLALILDIDALGSVGDIADLLGRLERQFPDVQVTCVTSRHDLPEEIENCILHRPFSLQKLEFALSSVLDRVS